MKKTYLFFFIFVNSINIKEPQNEIKIHAKNNKNIIVLTDSFGWENEPKCIASMDPTDDISIAIIPDAKYFIKTTPLISYLSIIIQ